MAEAWVTAEWQAQITKGRYAEARAFLAGTRFKDRKLEALVRRESPGGQRPSKTPGRQVRTFVRPWLQQVRAVWPR